MRSKTIFVSLIVFILLGPVCLSARTFQEDIFYQIMPISFYDSNGDSIGDFNGIVQAIPYLQNLGITGIWLNPVFQSKTYHGYQYTCNDTLNARFGTKTEFIQMVEAFHDAGIKVFIDLVAYGVGTDNAMFQKARYQPESEWDLWFAFLDPNNATWYRGPMSPYCPSYDWEGNYIDFVCWNLNHPPVREHLVEVLSHWVDPNGDKDFHDGVDGFRLDHLSVGDSEEAVWGYDLPFWEEITSGLRSVNPEILFIAEDSNWWTHHPDMFDYGIDAAFNTPLMGSLHSAIGFQSIDWLQYAMENSYGQALERGQWLGLLNNHDYYRIRSAIEDYYGYNDEQSQTLCKLAAAWLFTGPFPPVFYAGEEIGMRGKHEELYQNDANDLHIREPFEWNAVLTSPPHAYWYGGHQEYVVNERIQDNDGISRGEQESDPSSLLNHYRRLIDLRKDHSPLLTGRFSTIDSGDSTVLAFLRYNDSSSVCTALNLSDEERIITIDFTPTVLGSTARTVTDLWDTLSYPDITAENGGAYPLSIQPTSFVILEMSGKTGVSPFIMGGYLDQEVTLIGSTDHLQLWYAVKDSFLYVASTSAYGDTTHVADIFILISSQLTYMKNAPWTRSGYVAAWSVFLADENDNSYHSWYDQYEHVLPSHNTAACGAVLEGYILLKEIPDYQDMIYIALGEYGNRDGNRLLQQIPPGNGDGNIDFNEYARIQISPTIVDQNKGAGHLLPAKLMQNYPNPFNSSTTFHYHLSAPSLVVIKIYNITGQLVETLNHGRQGPGHHFVDWTPGHLASGVYLYEIVADNIREVKKCLLIK